MAPELCRIRLFSRQVFARDPMWIGAATTFQTLILILHTDGGGDLLGADIPKSMMLITTGSILILGLAVPAILPGYRGSVLGFNLSSGFGGGTSSFTMMNLLYAIFPSVIGLSLPTTVENQVWLAATTALFAAALGIVWHRARELNAIDVVALGLLIWLIPLRQIYTHYLVWAIVPFLMRGRLRQTLVVGSLLELANTMSSWSWNLQPDPFPVLSTPLGFFATSLVYLSVSLSALVFVMKETDPRRFLATKDADFSKLLERCPIPIAR